MQDFEKLGCFYLGREYDFQNKKSKEELLLYDSKDLVTHAVCVGMTGSGKTGLCIGILEEAAIDGIPAIVVDPKGDLSNLLLNFPDLKGEDFRPWVNEEDARKKGKTADEYAVSQAELWKKGLASWGQGSERIRKLREAAEFAIYTPGSSAGIPVSILKSFEAPGEAVIEDTDLLREKINTTVTSLLNLLGIDADPIQSKEHILLSTILDAIWRQGDDLDLGRFIQMIQTPPVNRIGVFDLESFFPSKERFALAMKLNNLLAAPGFQSWLSGEPLDIDSMLYTSEGKPKISIFSIAHLNDTERMFFVSLLLTQMLGWMRTQSGTNSLRSLFYMDEIYGYFPPVANPPSKAPLMTMLKQARAFGLGVVLATQNPVDLDYKGLSNTGTWFIGRLQTDRDKKRVLDGLEGAGSSSGGRFDRGKMEEILAGLGKRVFLMNNVHEDGPVIFETRWVMSYLRGPLTRNQIKKLMKKKVSEIKKPERAPGSKEKTGKKVAASKVSSRPVLPPAVPQFFIPVESQQPEGASLFYEPVLVTAGKAYYAHARTGIAAEKDISILAELPEKGIRISWDDAEEFKKMEQDLERNPEEEDADFGELGKSASLKKNYTRWNRDFKAWIYRTQRLELLKSASLGVVSEPGEDERDFRIRLQMSAREKRDEVVEKIRRSYVSKIARMEEKIRKSEHALEREKEQVKQQKLQTVISFGSTILSMLLGRKKVSRSSLGRASTTAGRAGRILKESKDVKRVKENLEVYKKQLVEMQDSLKSEIEEAKAGIDPLTEKLQPFIIKPKKTDISVSLTALAWQPYWKNNRGGLTPA